MLSFGFIQADAISNPSLTGKTLISTTPSTTPEIPDNIISQIGTQNVNVVDQAEIAPPNTFPTRKEGMSQEFPPQPMWGTDVLVSNISNPGVNGNVTTDHDALNGDMYVSFLCAHTDEYDTAYTYRSQDGGLTWQYFYIVTGNTTTGGIRDHEVVVGGDAGGAWIYDMVLYDGSGAYGGIWCRRMRNDLSGGAWIQVMVAGDTVSNISAGRNVEDPQHIFLCWQTTTLNIDMVSSADIGTTWGNHRNVSSGCRNPVVCAGGDAYVYIAYQMGDTTNIQVGRYTNNLISPSMVFVILDNTAEGDFFPAVAAQRTTPGTSQIAMCLFRHMHSNGNADFHYGYTYDGGVSWTSSPWPVTNQGHSPFDFRYPFAKVSYGSTLFRAGGTLYGGYDSLVYAYAQGTDPTTYSDRGVLNDYDVTGEFGGKVDYSVDCLGGYVVYRAFGSANIWCDAYNFTGIEESHGQSKGLISLAPNPNQGKAKLSYTISRNGNVRIAFYDASGRLLETLVNGDQKAGTYTASLNVNLPAGVYILRLDTPDGSTAKTMTVVK
jgi:hypothetical protein